MSRSGVGRVGAGSRPVRGSERSPVVDNPTELHFRDSDNVEAFLAHIADCGSVRAYCREAGLNQLHFMRLVENDPEFGEWYTTARKMRAHNMADEAVGLVAEMRGGEMSAQEVGAAAKVLQWDASKADREMYGDGPKQVGTVNIDLRGALIDARRRVEAIEVDDATGLVVEGVVGIDGETVSRQRFEVLDDGDLI